jgi:hypothetical protein
MSTCPDKDIHSIYIDNELPAAYVAEYEAHVKSCPRCQAQLNRLRAFRQTFSGDAKNMMLSQAALDAGFERLQARLSYSKVTGRNVHPFAEALKTSPTVRTIAGAAVAAAVVAIILPVRMTTKSSTNATQFQPVARVQIKSPANADVKVDGNLSTMTLSSLFGNSSDNTNSMASTVSNKTTLTSIPATVGAQPSLMVGIPTFVSSDSSSDSLASTLTSYDVFCPLVDTYDVSDTQADRSQGVSIQFNSALGHFFLEIGSQK